MTDLKKLRELQEQASQWADCTKRVEAQVALEALAPHLLPLAEALEKAIHPGANPTAWDDAKGVLEALQEALE